MTLDLIHLTLDLLNRRFTVSLDLVVDLIVWTVVGVVLVAGIILPAISCFWPGDPSDPTDLEIAE